MRPQSPVEKIAADIKIQVTKGNGNVDHLFTTDQEIKEAKHFAAALTVFENRLSNKCDKYQKCTARLWKAKKK